VVLPANLDIQGLQVYYILPSVPASNSVHRSVDLQQLRSVLRWMGRKVESRKSKVESRKLRRQRQARRRFTFNHKLLTINLFLPLLIATPNWQPRKTGTLKTKDFAISNRNSRIQVVGIEVLVSKGDNSV
jgi:hypothetical protein